MEEPVFSYEQKQTARKRCGTQMSGEGVTDQVKVHDRQLPTVMAFPLCIENAKYWLAGLLKNKNPYLSVILSLFNLRI